MQIAIDLVYIQYGQRVCIATHANICCRYFSVNGKFETKQPQ